MSVLGAIAYVWHERGHLASAASSPRLHRHRLRRPTGHRPDSAELSGTHMTNGDSR